MQRTRTRPPSRELIVLGCLVMALAATLDGGEKGLLYWLVNAWGALRYA